MNTDLSADDRYKSFLIKLVSIVAFVGLLLLLSWWYGQAGFEERFDPIEAANEKRDAVIKERDDAQRAWAEMGTKHERAIETILQLRDESTKNFKDLPYLTRRNYELAEENIVQFNEIERLKVIQQQHDDLLNDVSRYGMAAKRPETYQRESESLQRRLQISNFHLQQSEKNVHALKEMLKAQKDTANKEKDWLRAKLKKNARSAAYWAKFRRSDTSDDSKLAWGVRCACTEAETAYGLKDQTPRIVELESIVAARDERISRLRASRGNVLKNDASSQSNPTKTLLPSTSQPGKTTPVHNCEHEQQCKNLEKQVEDDAMTIRQLRKECQDLRDATSIEPTADATVTDAKAGYEGELATKDAMITELQEEKTKAREELATKDKEIDDLRADKRSAEEDAATKISSLNQKLSDSRKDLVDVREVATEREKELGRRKTRINELEANKSRLEDTIKQKDLEIHELEDANQEMAEQPAPESAETLQRLTTANTDLKELRHQYAECKGQSETQSARIKELEAAQSGLEDAIKQKDVEITTANTNLEELRHQYAECKGQSETQSARIRDLEATTTMKNNRIATLEEQISTAPTTDLIERQNQSHNEAITQKDQQYQVLRDLHNQTLNRLQLTEAKYNENLETLNTVQQNGNARLLELQRWLNESQQFHHAHSNCDERLHDLANQLRQRGNAFTDLQVKYNTQATELDTANKNVNELQSRVATLQQVNPTLEQKTSRCESDVEKYRVEGENRVRPTWQANFDRAMSALSLKLETSQGTVFKLQNQLQQAKNQANPLREMQLKSREDAVTAREDALKQDADDDVMDHDHQGGPQAEEQREIRSLEAKLGAAKKEVGDARLRINNFQRQLNKEKKERQEEKERHERERKREKEDFEKRSDVLKLRLETENPLKRTVSKLQNEVAVLKQALQERN